HVGMAGNDAVDTCTKEAALGASTPLTSCLRPLDSPLPLSKAATIAEGIKLFRACWLSEWTTSPRFTRLSTFDNATPSIVIARMYDDLSRPQSSMLTQLCTRHIGLNAYLYRFPPLRPL
ncbi:hypothetical protein DFH07DRAFT_722035, partial [Mycena maculata]